MKAGESYGIGMQQELRKWQWRHAVSDTVTRALALLFPPRCAVCDEILRRGERGCCAACRAKLPWVHEPACMKCGKPIARYEEEYCQDCRKDRHYFERGSAAFVYAEGMRHSIYRMKAENRRDYLDFYAEAMVQALTPHLLFWQPECLVPVPMHWKKKRKRGYNQAVLLARKISRLTGIPVKEGLVRCVRPHAEQKLLGRAERLRNLAGSFAVQEPVDGLKCVLLIDDVYTTGSTVDELSRILKQAGIRRVYFLVLCIGKGKKTVCTAENVCYTE